MDTHLTNDRGSRGGSWWFFGLLLGGLGPIALSLVALLGWYGGWLLLASFKADLAPMAPSAAVGFLCFGAAVCLRAWAPWQRRIHAIGRALAWLGTLVSLLLFTTSVLGIQWSAEHPGLDDRSVINGFNVGHMATITAFGFLLAGLSFLSLRTPSPTKPARARLALGAASLLLGINVAVVLAYLFGPPMVYGGRFFPPAPNTVLAFVLLGGALLAEAGRQAKLFQRWSDNDVHAATVCVLVFLLAAGGIVTAAWLYYRTAANQQRQTAEKELQTIAQFESDRLAQWREDSLADADVLMESNYFKEALGKWRETQNPVETERALTRFRSMAEHYHGADVMLVDPNGQILLSIAGRSGRLHEEAQQAVAAALRDRRAVMTDLHAGPGAQPIHLDVIAPLFDDKAGAAEPRGAIILQHEAKEFLYPLINAWPVPSASGEMTLVRRDGSDVQFLNEFRDQKFSVLATRIPLTRQDVPAVMAVLGKRGVVQGVDYRGVEVLAALQAVPNSPWFLVAKVDTAEAFATLRSQLWDLCLGVLLLLLAVALTLGFLWQQRRAGQRIRQLNQDLEVRVLERTAELSQSEEKFRAFFERSNVGKSLTLPNGKLEPNPALCAMLGYSREELQSRTWQSLTHPEDVALTQRMIDQLLSGQQESTRFEKRFFHKDGSVVWVDLSSTVQRDAAGQPLYLMSAVIDITERKRAEAAAAASQRLVQEITDNSTSLIYALDLEGRFQLINRSLERVFGVPRETMLGKSREALLPPAIAAAHRANDLAVMRSQQPQTTEEENIEADGKHTYLSVKFPLIGANGQVHGVGGISTDITDRARTAENEHRLLTEATESRRVLLSVLEDQKRAEEEIRRLNASLEQRVRDRTAELAAANRELEAFSYSVSHDLRAPLRAMNGFSMALLDDYAGKLDATAKDYLRFILAGSQQMAGLIDDLLNLSRLSRTEMQHERVDLTAIAEEAGAELRRAQPGRAVELVVAPALTADADKRMVRVVFNNLLGNAWKFTGKCAAARIEVGTWERDGERGFFVRDNGAGFDMAYADKLFGAFQRLHSTAEFEGNGIGLALVRRIIHRHGGRVWAEGAVGQGATFYFTLGGKL